LIFYAREDVIDQLMQFWTCTSTDTRYVTCGTVNLSWLFH